MRRIKITRLKMTGPALVFLFAVAGLLAAERSGDTIVYSDALWLRVHAEDCPSLILKEEKRTMTLAEADRAGYRIGKSGQSGRGRCCLDGYKRKHPEKKLTDQDIVAGNDLTKNYKHIPGCHRYQAHRNHKRWPIKEAMAQGFKVCLHCRERGPSLTSVSAEAWSKTGSATAFVPPAGWVPTPYSTEAMPSRQELEILIQETLEGGNGIQELQFEDPVASLEHFMIMRFFFPLSQWRNLYIAYRATGDQRLLDTLLESARHYNELAAEFPSVARKKASDPEGLPFMLSMAAWSRITLQKARKDPGEVSAGEIAEAEGFLRTMIAVLRPTYENSASIDPQMGLPQMVADDFRTRAFNRSLNGIGTMSMMTAAIEDLQALKKTEDLPLLIHRYRWTVREYIEFWHRWGDFVEFDGRSHFYYPYAPRQSEPRIENGCKIYKRPEDIGHYSHSLQGAMFVYESAPELGIDDKFLTAVANALHHNATTKIKRKGRMVLSGHAESPTASRIRPYGSNRGGHQYSPARSKIYVLQAFREDMIKGLCNPLSGEQIRARNSEYEHRLGTLYAHYVKALRKDRSLIHLGEQK